MMFQRIERKRISLAWDTCIVTLQPEDSVIYLELDDAAMIPCELSTR